MKVRELERSLLDRFPVGDAEAWDHVGLSAGDPDDEVRRVAVALDATEGDVRRAADLGANVLLTHHPVYISAPDAFVPRAGAAPACAAAVYAAIALGVGVISLHTNLDRSREARDLLPALVGLTASASLEHPGEPDRPGLGAVAEAGPGLDAAELARRCADAFSTDPRVWGEPDRPVSRAAFLGGSLGHMGGDVVAAGCDAVVTGEAGYHAAQDLARRGVAVVLLGHDRSEQPFTGILADAARACGVPAGNIATIDAPTQWWTLTRGDRA